jgi:hypothetical protein
MTFTPEETRRGYECAGPRRGKNNSEVIAVGQLASITSTAVVNTDAPNKAIPA